MKGRPTLKSVPAGRLRDASPFGALVLAGSLGWGKAQTRGLRPRPLASVALRPLISYALDWLVTGGAHRITICAQGSSDQLRAGLGGLYDGIALQYEEDQFPRGPAGCIKDAAERMTGDPIVVIEGTIVAPSSVLSLPQLLDEHRRSGATMTVVTSPGARADEHLRPAGIYVLQRRALDFVLETGFQDIKETMIPKLHRAGEHLAIHELGDVCRRVGNLETYLSANFWLTERVAAAGRPMGGRRAAHGDVSIHPTAQVADDTLIVGPVLVGARARIQSGATVVGPAVIGDGAVVEAGALVSRSVVGNDCCISRDAIVHGCVVADDAAVESGAHLYHSMKQRERSKSTWLRRLAARWAAPRPRVPQGRPAIAESGLIQLPRRVASVPTGSDARR